MQPPIVGRQDELARLAELVTVTERPVTILGSPGAGKTRLALELAARDPEALWLSVQRRTSARAALAGALVALHRQPRPSLVVLDGCEGIARGIDTAIDALAMRGVRAPIVATSTDVLGIRGEVVLPIAPLRLPEGEKLVAHLGADARPLVDQLDGMPLLLQLAAGASAAQRADLFGRFARLREAGRRIERKRLVEETLEWALDCCDERELAALERLHDRADDESWDQLGNVLDADGIGREVADRLARRALLQPHLAPRATGWSLPPRVREALDIRRAAVQRAGAR